MDLHDPGNIQLRRHPAGGGSKGADGSQDHEIPFRDRRAEAPSACVGQKAELSSAAA